MASDSINDTYPNYVLISDYLRSDGIPKWSFNQGIGQDIFPFSFPDPFVSLLYMLGRNYLAYGIAYMELMKIFAAGIIFYLFLKKRSLAQYVCIIGGLLYSFSSFIIFGSCWNIFSTEAVYLAFLLLAFEKLFQDNNRILFPIAIALIAILQPFDLWIFGIFLFVYILARHYENDKPEFRNLLNLILKTGLLACLGIGISSVFFLSETKLMLNSPRVRGSSGYFAQLMSQFPLSIGSEKHNVTAVMRLFSSDLLGGANNYGGWYNFMEAPLFYCGLINLLLVPQLFQFLDKRRKLIYAMLLAFFILPIVFPFMRYSFWLFTGDYYRIFSFFVAFILMFFSVQALNYMFKYKKVNRILLLITSGILLAVLYFPYHFLDEHSVLDTDLRNIIVLFLIIYTVLLFFLKNSKRVLPIQLSILGLVCIELISFSTINVNDRKALTVREYKQKTGYSDYTVDAMAYLNKIDKGFFRVTKSYSSGPSMNGSLNDSKIQRFKGTSSYHSFNHRHYVRFLSGMNLIDENKEDQTRWIVGLRDVPFLHSFVSIKYFLINDSRRFKHINYDSLTTIGNVRILRNKYVLPLGFTYDQMINREDFTSLTSGQKAVALYKAFVVSDSGKNYSKVFPSYSVKDISGNFTARKYIEELMSLKKDSLAISKFSNNSIKGTITLKERKMLFLSVPYSEGWSAWVDGKKQQPVRINIGFMGLLLEKGDHKVELSFTPPLFFLGTIITLFSLLLYFVLILYPIRRRSLTDNLIR